MVLQTLLSAIRRVADGKIVTISWKFWGVKPLEPKIQDTMLIEREWFTDKSTIGTLSFDGEFFCFTLEDTCRRKKIYGKTAIPSGRYEVIIDFSKRHQREMPLIVGVPGFDGIRFDIANKADEVLGCVAVGFKRGVDEIYESRKAHESFMAELRKRLAKGKVYLSVVGGVPREQFTA